MKAKEELKSLRNESEKDLINDLNESYSRLMKLKFNQSFGKLKNHREIKKNKIKISRIWTILQEKSAKEQV